MTSKAAQLSISPPNIDNKILNGHTNNKTRHSGQRNCFFDATT